MEIFSHLTGGVRVVYEDIDKCVCVCLYIYRSVDMCVYAYVTYVHVYTHVFVCMHVHLYVCMYVCIRISAVRRRKVVKPGQCPVGAACENPAFGVGVGFGFDFGLGGVQHAVV